MKLPKIVRPESAAKREIVRDLWLFAVTVLLALAVVHFEDRVGGQINEIQQGRRLGTDINCGTTQAFLQVNKATIEGSTAPSQTPAEERKIEELGFGNKQERDAHARSAGVAYVRSVQAAIVLFAGKNAAKVIILDKKNGGVLVNCANVKQITAVK